MDRLAVKGFFTALFRQVEPGMLVNISTLDKTKVMKQYWRVSPEEKLEVFIEALTETVIKAGKNKNVFVSGGLYESKSRLAENVAGTQGFWLDIDVGTVGHNKGDLPPTIEDALELLSHLPEPTLIVHSGHGLQVWFLLDESWIFEDPGEYTDAARLSAKVNHALKMWAKTMGWSTDNVGDLSRLMRVPGSDNVKEEPHVPVTILKGDGPYWGLDSLNRAIILPPNVGGYKTPDVPEPRGPIANVAGQLIVESGREPSAKLLKALWRAAPKAERIYDNREFPTDDTKSGVDYTLATYAAKAGGLWTPQAICDLLIMRAEEHGFPLKTPHYYKFTINRVLDYNKETIQHNEVLEDLAEARKPEGKTKEEQSQQLYDKVLRVLGIDVNIAIIQPRKVINGELVPTGNRTYRFTAKDGQQRTLLRSQLSSQKEAKDELSEAGIYIYTVFKPMEWSGIVNDIGLSAAFEYVSEEETEEGEIKSHLASWFMSMPKVDGRSQIRMLNSRDTSPFLWPENSDNQTIAFCNTAFKKYLRNQVFSQIDPKPSTLKSIGAVTDKATFRDGNTTRSMHVWLMPSSRPEDEQWREIASRMRAASYRQTVKAYEELQERQDAPE